MAGLVTLVGLAGERLLRALEEQVAAIEALPAALLRQAFRGEL